MKTFDVTRGSLPIVVSMPHNGTQIPDYIAANMELHAHRVVDTDWYLDKLYDFAIEMGCNLIKPVYSRYVIDLNRPETNMSLYPGSDTTELCPTTQFDKKPIYLSGKEPTDSEIRERIETFWRPYHDALDDLINETVITKGFCLLFEAHSIKSFVPRFFSGSLPDFNLGTFDTKSCSEGLSMIIEHWKPAGYSKVINERFKGGYITRHYGSPQDNIDSLQLELSQATYLEELTLSYDEEKAAAVKVEIRKLFEKLKHFSVSRAKEAKL